MTDLHHLERQLSRLRDQLAVFGAASPTPADLADQDAADHAMAQRIHRARPVLPLHHVYITLQALRAVQELDAPKPEETDTTPARPQRATHSCGQEPHTWGCVTTAEHDDTDLTETAPAATEEIETRDPTHGLSTQHAYTLWNAIAPPGPDRPPYTVQYERVCRATAGILREQPFQTVQGRCPACANSLLFLGDGGHVTCSLADCPNPSAVDERLHGTHDTHAA
ncbi:hypothetical protein [Streptomyces mirabilis]